MSKRTRAWVGIRVDTGKYETFNSTPTVDSHGALYAACIGPFRTVRGANWMAAYGQGNPHCQTVSHAEYDAKRAEGRFIGPVAY